jgi:hypothetical protein
MDLDVAIRLHSEDWGQTQSGLFRGEPEVERALLAQELEDDSD